MTPGGYPIPTASESASYTRGAKLGAWWIRTGGDLLADGPDTSNEAFYNGFIDTLASERRERAAAAS